MYYFIINPNAQSGRGIKIWKQIKQKLDFNKIKYTHYFTTERMHGVQLTRDIMADNIPKILIVLGGDGTVNEVINGITNPNNITLAYIPTGSSNDFARSLNLPPNDPLYTLSLILNSDFYVHKIDHGIISSDDLTSRKFSTNSGIGLDALICKNALESKIKKFLNIFGLGKLTYAIILLQQLFRYPACQAKLILDNHRTYQFNSVYLIASNIHPFAGGGMRICPRANPTDNQIDLCIVHDISPIKILLLFPLIFLGKHTHLNGVTLLRAKHATIQLDQPAYVHTDGEIYGQYDKIYVGCTNYKIKTLFGK